MPHLIAERHFKLAGSTDSLKFAVFVHPSSSALFFIHSPWLSSQTPLNELCVKATLEGDAIRLELTNGKNPLIHQSWAIDPAELTELIAYFRTLGYRMEDCDPFGLAEKEATH
ncbi:MAG: hypothetical protein ACRCXH_13380 [Shewanella sp.]|uniref:hypothetical protein n=1 Tax=Shewanella sp. TaxID=50422 RepID=UPI003F3FDC7B